ncbi:MAG TPA: PTS sugar transporter subunit IIC [Dongiaceae bacterium]|nr:PTS sugar transporter subunit IIC [Dongiaceae bacterium]
MIPKVLVTVLLGGIAALDATPVAQTLLSQPLVTASLLGLVWGQSLLAVKVGVVLQLFAAGTLPVGARTPEDYATGGVIGAGTALLLASSTQYSFTHEASAFAGCVVGMVASMAGVPLVKWQRRRNEGLSRWCEEALRRGDLSALGRANAAGVVMAFGVGVVFCAVFLAASAGLVAPVVHRRSLGLARAWGLAQPLWLGFGLAHLLAAFVQRRFMRAALFGVGLVVGWILLLVEA